MNVIEGLRNTSKGKLKYDLKWKGTQEELDECSPKAPVISCRLDLLQSMKKLSLEDNGTRSDISPQSERTAMSFGEDSALDSTIGPECFDSTHVSLHRYEQSMKQEARARLEERKRLFEQHSEHLHEEKTRNLQQQLEERRNKFLELVQGLKQDLRNYEIQTANSQKALKVQHEKSAARVATKVQMLELKKRQAEEQEKNKKDLLCLQKSHNETVNIYRELEAVTKNCSSLGAKTVTIVDEAKKVLNLSLNTFNDCISAGRALDGAIEHLPQYFNMMRTLLSNAKQAIAEAEQKAKKEMAEKEAKKREEEERKKQEEAKKKEEQAAKSTETLSTTISKSSIAEYGRLEKLLEEVNKSIEPLTSTTDKTIKKLKMALQRAVTTPINTISDQSPAHLLDKISELSKLLSGQQIESFGNALSTSIHPCASVSFKRSERQE